MGAGGGALDALPSDQQSPARKEKKEGRDEAGWCVGGITVERSGRASLVVARRHLAETPKTPTSSKREREKMGKEKKCHPLTSLPGRQSAARLSEDRTACLM